MPPKSVQTRTPLYAPQEQAHIPGPIESFLRGMGVPLDLAGPAAAMNPLFKTQLKAAGAAKAAAAVPTMARSGVLKAAARGALGPAVPLTVASGASGTLGGLVGKAYARLMGNPTAQTRPRLVPGGAFQPEDSVFRDPSIQTQGDVEALLAEMSQERARSQAADNLYEMEQALEVERYLRQGAPYVATADDFEPLEVYP